MPARWFRFFMCWRADKELGSYSFYEAENSPTSCSILSVINSWSKFVYLLHFPKLRWKFYWVVVVLFFILKKALCYSSPKKKKAVVFWLGVLSLISNYLASLLMRSNLVKVIGYARDHRLLWWMVMTSGLLFATSIWFLKSFQRNWCTKFLLREL